MNSDIARIRSLMARITPYDEDQLQSAFANVSKKWISSVRTIPEIEILPDESVKPRTKNKGQSGAAGRAKRRRVEGAAAIKKNGYPVRDRQNCDHTYKGLSAWRGNGTHNGVQQVYCACCKAGGSRLHSGAVKLAAQRRRGAAVVSVSKPRDTADILEKVAAEYGVDCKAMLGPGKKTGVVKQAMRSAIDRMSDLKMNDTQIAEVLEVGRFAVAYARKTVKSSAVEKGE